MGFPPVQDSVEPGPNRARKAAVVVGSVIGSVVVVEAEKTMRGRTVANRTASRRAGSR